MTALGCSSTPHQNTHTRPAEIISIARSAADSRGVDVNDYDIVPEYRTNYWLVTFCWADWEQEAEIVVGRTRCPFWIYISSQGEVLSYIGLNRTAEEMKQSEDALRRIYAQEEKESQPAGGAYVAPEAGAPSAHP